MARSAKDETGDGHGVSAIRGNGFDRDMVQSFVDRLLDRHAELDKIATARMGESKEVRNDMKEILGEAKSAGIPKKSLKGVVAKILLERRADAIREELEGDDQDAFDKLEQSLGMLAELPLGQSALAAARKGPELVVSAP
jgi:uncharacterized protein (UPF0335 family)